MSAISVVTRPAAASALPVVAVATVAEAGEWDAFVESRADATGYHRWAWRRVFERVFGHECIYLVARRDGAIEGILPLVSINSVLFGRSVTSLPFLNYGGVVGGSESV